MTGLAYVAYPIDFGNELGTIPAHVAAEILAELGWTAYLPGEALVPAVNGQVTPDVAAVNMAVIRLAKLVVALWPEGVASVGVPLDVQFARDLGHPTHVLHTGWLDASWSAHDWTKHRLDDWSEPQLRKILENML